MEPDNMAIDRRFSHSLIDSYKRCPRFAYFRYVEKLPERKTTALIKGSACDTAWNVNLEQKIESRQDLPVEDVLQVAENAFRDEVDGAGGRDAVEWASDRTQDAALDSVIRMAKAYHLALAPDVQPLAVQVELHRPLESGRDFIGFLDLEAAVEGVICVADNKTGKRRMPEQDADVALQPFAYAWLKNEPVDFAFLRVVDTGKNVSTETVWTERTSEDIAVYQEFVDEADRAFTNEVFPRNPTSMYCGPTKCQFWNACMPTRTIQPAT